MIRPRIVYDNKVIDSTHEGFSIYILYKIMKIIIRISFFIYRFFISIENLGILNSFKIFFLSESTKKKCS